MIRKFQEEREVFLFCDFHGHSRRKNVFMYGCSNKPGYLNREKLFPNLLSKNCNIFSFSDTCFNVQKSKESTGRVVAWKDLGIQNSYTLEASFCGSDFGIFADYHFNRGMLEDVGHQFCQAIYDFCEPDQVKIKKSMEELEIAYSETEDRGSDANSDYESDGLETENKKKKAKEAAATVQNISVPIENSVNGQGG
eukprot:TRINITY_DN2401_c0_g3_i1.p1 TRINITY_DN2401_c0_g3~~TRINITY_DN2401_c0_g3_i1.p1  ORF type:complete len:195 (+),score=62.66 TRINITY_DN2401_c0_g3_i1:227-811(+)